MHTGGDVMRSGKRRRDEPSMPDAAPPPADETSTAADVLPTRRGPPPLLGELMEEVLIRLPIKSILRFRAVCRSWDSLLSSDEFRRLHDARMAMVAPPPKLLSVSPTSDSHSSAVCSCSLSGSGSGSAHDQLLTLDVGTNHVEVTASSCHGLTLLYDAMTPAYYVFNAATRAVTRLPPCQGAIHATAGLGFDARTKEYKVVRLLQGLVQDGIPIRCEVYTLGGAGGDHWMPAAVPPGLGGLAYSAIRKAWVDEVRPVLANGSLHWLIQPGIFLELRRDAVLSFSLADETFGSIRSPPFVAKRAHLVELDGQLSMVRDLRYGLPAGRMLEIWKLRDYNASGDWSLDCRIDLSGHGHWKRDLLVPQIVNVIGSIGNRKSGSEKIIIATSEHKVFATYEHKVFAYDPVSHALETIGSNMESRASCCRKETSHVQFSLFRESLTPVHKTREEIASSTPMSKATKEILLLLPPKSVFKFQLVCKHWLGLTKNESFVRAYFAHKNTDGRPKIMLVGKGSGESGFEFIPLSKLLQGAANQSTSYLETKVVCSKPCHGLNLVSLESKNYVFNPCTGFHRVYLTRVSDVPRPANIPVDCSQPEEDNPFAFGNKIFGIGFDQTIQEHVVVRIFYHWKSYTSRQYSLTCILWMIGGGCLELLPPPLPVNGMPPVYLEGKMYWMSEPRLGPSSKRAIICLDIATRWFGVISCPSCIAAWDITTPRHAFVVELQGMLCAVLADPIADELHVWKLDHGRWDRVYTIYLKVCPGYSLATNVVVPLAIGPTDGRVLLSTGRKLGWYNPFNPAIENLLALDQASLSTSEEFIERRPGVHQKPRISRWDVPPKLYPYELSMAPCENSVQPSRASSVQNPKIMPFVPLLYEESLAYYPTMGKGRLLNC